jgi:phosphatidylserine synthase
VYLHPLPLSVFEENLSNVYTISIIVLLGILGFLMISTLRYTSFKTTASGRQSGYLILIIAALGMLIWLYSRYILFAIAVTYVAHGVIWYLLNLLRPSRRMKDAQIKNPV